MGKTTGFLEFERKEMEAVSPEEFASRDFHEFHAPLQETLRRGRGDDAWTMAYRFVSPA